MPARRIKLVPGEKFNMLTVVRKAPKGIGGRRAVYRCDCGVEKNLAIKEVRRGKVLSCGCLRGEDVNIGETFGRLKVVACVGSNDQRRRMWECHCECGFSKIVSSQGLREGTTKSCGCLFHGMCDSPVYNSWSGMKRRCLDQNNPEYSYYGGRGITICSRLLKVGVLLRRNGKPTN